MKISIITTFPQLHETFFTTSLIARAVEKKLISYNLLSFADFCEVKKSSTTTSNLKERIDEPTCGPGPGMIIKPEIVQRALEHCVAQWGKGFTIFFSPQGKQLNQPLLRSLSAQFLQTASHPNDSKETFNNSTEPHIILVCPRYEGVDSRVEEHYADLVLSVGDYVLMGGDVPAQIFLEGLLRLIPHVVGNVESIEQESFESPFFDHPQFGLPLEWEGKKIPELITSGNHNLINAWRKKEAAHKTLIHRFDWFKNHPDAKAELETVNKLIPKHYVCLMHSNVMIGDGTVEGNSSVTSIDIHDLSRSSSTYGIENVFLVSPLEDQQAIMDHFLGFWKSSEGKEYNSSRHAAVSRAIPVHTFEQAIEAIEKKEGKKPLVVATSAKHSTEAQRIDYHSQGTVWQHDRPVLLVFGTAQGLSPAFLSRCDYLLIPVFGLTNYNHLSVRSAVAIILDRWIGLNPKIK